LPQGKKRQPKKKSKRGVLLRDNILFLKSILEHIPDMVFVKDAEELRFVAFNKAGEELLGIPVAEIIGKNDYDFFPAKEAEAFISKDRAVIKAKELVDIPEEPIHTKNKGVRFLHTKKIPILSEDGQPQYLLGISEDITDRKDTVEALQKSYAELETFSYTVSHDLRSPLRAIEGYAGILMEDYAADLKPEVQRLLGAVRQNAKHMAQLIEDLLNFARLSRHGMIRRPVDLRKMVQFIVNEKSAAAAGQKTNIVLDLLPTVSGDETLVHQVYENLLSNAYKFTRKNPAPRIEIGSLKKDGQQVFFVRDNGVGFDMAYVDKLFGVFQRLHAAEEFEGTGVGLAIVQRIIQCHGGRIWAEGKPDQGAAFYFTLQPAPK
jgi:PAS domain S-box-containing protein